MARARVPKSSERFEVIPYGNSFAIYDNKNKVKQRLFCTTFGRRDRAHRIARALNFLEAIERGELIVKEAE